MILQIKKRKRKAYSTAFIVSVSYLSLQVIKPLLSNERYQIKLARRHQRNAARVMGTIVELNGLFIKVGQLLSILSNILPESYRTALETLQDKAPASSCERIEETILSELNQSCYTIFDDFSREPIASASIGQVHIAYLKTGQKVAVKVQHSHIEKLADLDLKIVESLVKMTGKIFKINGLENIYSQIRIMIEEELDYSYEAIAMASVKLSLKKYDKIIVPEVFNEFSSTKVLVTAFCEGKKVTNPDLYESGQVSANAVCENLMEAYCKMFLVDGYYHADPHPG
ncbi:MAG: AarF/ABC1/UbiB kinase family protein, partial [Putridiphycobacter sp.]|nr:AarF/ABC1/UbiB kinase family protein [Putridiphycobacter sp.]